MRAWRAQGSEWVCPSCLLPRRSQRVQDGNGGHPVLLVNFQSDSMDSGLFHSVLSTNITLWELHTQRECGGQPYQRCHHRGMGDPPENGGIGDSQGKNGGTQGRMEGIQGPQGENGRSREPPWAAWGAAMLALSWEQGDPQSRMEGVGRQPPPRGIMEGSHASIVMGGNREAARHFCRPPDDHRPCCGRCSHARKSRAVVR